MLWGSVFKLLAKSNWITFPCGTTLWGANPPESNQPVGNLTVPKVLKSTETDLEIRFRDGGLPFNVGFLERGSCGLEPITVICIKSTPNRNGVVFADYWHQIC